MSFSFGTPTSAPASGLSSSFSFGANKPATPGFGLTSTTQASTGLFGSTQATPAPAFGSTAAPAFGSTAAPAFGSTAAPAFGSTATPAFGSTATPAFGSTAAPAFGSTAAPAFGSTAAPAFGSTAAPAFGSTATPAFGATTAPLNFGSTTTPAFGTTGFGTGGLNFGAGTGTAAPATGLSFGAPATTTASTGLGGFGFGTSSTAAQPSLGLFGATSTATTSAGLFGAKLGTTTATVTTSSTIVTPSLGLGGVVPSTNAGASSTTAGDGKTEPPKQTNLPNEILTSVESFKEFIKKQKSLSSEVMRASIKPMHKVSRDADELQRAVIALSGEVSKCRAQSRRIRSAGANALATVERAQRDGLEPEGCAPPAYVKHLICELEQQLLIFKRQMEVADKQMQASPKMLTEQELTLGIRRMHESLVALAGRLQAVHTQVDAQKEQYLNYRRYILKDPTNVFEDPPSGLDQILRDSEGSKRKTKLSGLGDFSQGSAVLSDPKMALGNAQLAGPTPFTYMGSGFSPYPIPDSSVPTWQPQPPTPAAPSSLSTAAFGSFGADSSSFHLQKPPGKRGKQ